MWVFEQGIKGGVTLTHSEFSSQNMRSKMKRLPFQQTAAVMRSELRVQTEIAELKEGCQTAEQPPALVNRPLQAFYLGNGQSLSGSDIK